MSIKYLLGDFKCKFVPFICAFCIFTDLKQGHPKAALISLSAVLTQIRSSMPPSRDRLDKYSVEYGSLYSGSVRESPLTGGRISQE